MTTYIIHVHTPGHQAASMGHTVLRRLEQSRRLQHPPLGMLSPLDQEEEREKGRGGTKAGEERMREQRKKSDRKGGGNEEVKR